MSQVGLTMGLKLQWNPEDQIKRWHLGHISAQLLEELVNQQD